MASFSLLCSRINRRYYESCSSVCLSVGPQPLVRFLFLLSVRLLLENTL